MDRLLFVGGFPSGGTTLLRSILNAHPEIYISGEMPLLKNLMDKGYSQATIFKNSDEIKKLQDYLVSINFYGNIENINYDFEELLSENQALTLNTILRHCFSDQQTLIWGNKTPQNTENLNLLYELFPNAYFLIITRDIRDVCLSWRKRWGKDMILCAHKWATRMKKGWIMSKEIPADRIKFISFEDLLTNTQDTVQSICDFLGIAISERMQNHHQYVGKVTGDHGKINYGKPIEPKNHNNWKTQLADTQVKRIEEIAYETLKLFGYQVEYAVQRIPISKAEILRGRIRDTVNMLFFGNRVAANNGLKNRLWSIYREFKIKFG